MAPRNLLIASWNFTQAPSFSHGLGQFIADRNMVIAFIRDRWSDFIAWLSQPQVYACIITWAIVFTLVLFLILSLGFSPTGVVAGSMAAAFQGWMYGGFTPAAGVFATLTSLGMLGILAPPATILAAIVATIVTLIVWACGGYV